MKWVSNHRGLTLVELILSLALISLIVLLVTSLQLFGKNQMTYQSERTELQSEVRLALNIITKDIRSAETVQIENNILTVDGEIIKKEGTHITKNGNAIASNIQEFHITEKQGKIDIKVASIAPKQGKPITQSTVIYLRE